MPAGALFAARDRPDSSLVSVLSRYPTSLLVDVRASGSRFLAPRLRAASSSRIRINSIHCR